MQNQFLFDSESLKSQERAFPDNASLFDTLGGRENYVVELYFKTASSRVNRPINLMEPERGEDNRLIAPRLPDDIILDEFTGTVYDDSDTLVKMLTDAPATHRVPYTTSEHSFKSIAKRLRLESAAYINLKVGVDSTQRIKIRKENKGLKDGEDIVLDRNSVPKDSKELQPDERIFSELSTYKNRYSIIAN